MQYRIRPAGLLLIGVLLGGCQDSAGPAPAARVVSVTIDSAMGPLIREAVVRLDRASAVTLTYSAAGTRVLSIGSDSVITEHRVLLPRLRAQRSYLLDVRPEGAAAATRSQFTTGALPANLVALQFAETGTPTSPVSIVEFVGGGYLGVVFIEDGEVVWYHPTSGSLFGSTRRANGDIVLLDPQRGLISIRPDGSLAHRLPQPDSAPGAPYGRLHHDVTATPRNTLLLIANETRRVGAEDVVGEALWEWTPETGAVVKRWSAFDHLDFARDRGSRSSAGNWLHANGVAFGARGNVLLSMRNADLVASIAPDFSAVEWTLGGQAGTLQVADADRFYGQHFVSEPSPGRLLVYDNGWERPDGAYTRVIEYAVDPAQQRATRVWQYRRDPDVYAALVGSAHRLANGHTVILYGMSPGENSSTGPLMAVEVTSAGQEVWRLQAPPGVTRLYRVTPVASVLGEVAVQPGG